MIERAAGLPRQRDNGVPVHDATRRSSPYSVPERLRHRGPWLPHDESRGQTAYRSHNAKDAGGEGVDVEAAAQPAGQHLQHVHSNVRRLVRRGSPDAAVVANVPHLLQG